MSKYLLQGNIVNSEKIRIHWSFWLIGAITLIWNVMGSINFIAQMNPETVASMPEAYRAVIGVRPLWATGAFAIAVFGGTLGCVLLLFRKSKAFYLFIASLLGVIVTMIHTLSISSSNIDFTPVWIGTMMSLVVAALLVWYSKKVESKGWIN